MLHAIETRTRHASAKSFRYYEKKPVHERMPREISSFAKRMSSDERPDYPPASFYQAPADAQSLLPGSSFSTHCRYKRESCPNRQLGNIETNLSTTLPPFLRFCYTSFLETSRIGKLVEKACSRRSNLTSL